MHLSFTLSETSCMHRAFMPSNVTHALPCLGPRRNFTSGTKDVPPPRPYKHRAFVNIAIHKAFRTSKKDGSVRRFMQIIIERNENICRVVVIWNVLT